MCSWLFRNLASWNLANRLVNCRDLRGPSDDIKESVSDELDDEIPATLLLTHPELVAVGKALEQLRAGTAVSATCIKCGKTLVAETVEVIGAIVIRCPAGHTSFRARRSM